MSLGGRSGQSTTLGPQAALEVLPHLIWGTDEEGRWVYTNQRLRAFSGHDASPTEQDFLSSLHPHDRQRVEAGWQQARLERQPSALEVRLQHRDGQFRWTLCQYQPVEQHSPEQHSDAGFAWCGTCTDIHAQRQRLKDASDIIETSRDCIKFIDLQGRLVYMNAGGMQEMEIPDFGVCDHAFWPEFWSGAMRPQVDAAIEEARAGRVGRFEGFCPTFAGTPRWWSVRVSPMYDASGELERFLAVSRDITDRVQAELQAERWQSVSTALTGALSQEEVVDIILSQGLSVLQADAGGVLLVSQDGEHLEALSHRGYPQDMVQRFSRFPLSLPLPINDVIRDGVARFLTSEDVDRQYPQLAGQRGGMRGSVLLPLSVNGRVMGGLILGFRENRVFSGADRRFLITLAAQCAQALERARLYDSVRELNQSLEQRVQERTRELERERSFMQAMLESLTEGIVACDAGGMLTVFNGATRALHGLPAKPLAPQEWANHYRLYQSDGVTPLSTEQIPLYRAFSGEQVRDVDMMVMTQNGQARHLRTNGNAIYSASGEKLGAVVAMHDITEHRRAEEKLRQANEELRRSNAELEQFAYVASHDLQEPLRTVSSFTELLARRYQGQLDENADVYIGHVTKGVQRMKRLIEDLLGFSRLNAARQHRSVNTTDALDAAQAQLALAISETGALVTHDPLPCLPADEGRLTQLFQNLIGNAIKFRRAGVTPQVHIGAVREGAWWHFSVRDNGIGIDQAYFERIFVIFQRLHTRETFDGTGIGLAVCRKIVEHHGGRIWVESTVGEGSVFHFTLSAQPMTD